jgi:hypothetical protein
MFLHLLLETLLNHSRDEPGRANKSSIVLPNGGHTSRTGA